jgi:uncharacterized protein YraI
MKNVSRLPSLRRLALLAAGALLLSAGAAFAAPGIASVNANVRAGPGTGYAVVDRLEKGEYVIVKSCGANWCAISHIGNNGYVSRALIYNPYYGSRGYYMFAPKRPVPGR